MFTDLWRDVRRRNIPLKVKHVITRITTDPVPYLLFWVFFPVLFCICVPNGAIEQSVTQVTLLKSYISVVLIHN